MTTRDFEQKRYAEQYKNTIFRPRKQCQRSTYQHARQMTRRPRAHNIKPVMKSRKAASLNDGKSGAQTIQLTSHRSDWSRDRAPSSQSQGRAAGGGGGRDRRLLGDRLLTQVQAHGWIKTSTYWPNTRIAKQLDETSNERRMLGFLCERFRGNRLSNERHLKTVRWGFHTSKGSPQNSIPVAKLYVNSRVRFKNIVIRVPVFLHLQKTSVAVLDFGYTSGNEASNEKSHTELSALLAISLGLHLSASNYRAHNTQ